MGTPNIKCNPRGKGYRIKGQLLRRGRLRLLIEYLVCRVVAQWSERWSPKPCHLAKVRILVALRMVAITVEADHSATRQICDKPAVGRNYGLAA